VTWTAISSIRATPPAVPTESFRRHGVNYYETQFGPLGVRGLSDIGLGLDGMDG
jgi:hypothetical protein